MAEHTDPNKTLQILVAEPPENPEMWLAPDRISELCHRAGHDVGNPLTAIISLASILEYSAGSGQVGIEKLREYSASIVGEAWKIAHITERLVMIYSQRRGNPIECSVGDLAEKVLQRVRSRYEFEDLEIESDFFFAPTANKVVVDVDQFTILLQELFVNGYNFQRLPKAPSPEPERRTMRCTLEPHDQFVRLRFVNPLPAPIEGNLSDLFLPLVCKHASPVRTGLGLAAVWAIVHRHGGKLHIEQRQTESGYEFAVDVLLPAMME